MRSILTPTDYDLVHPKRKSNRESVQSSEEIESYELIRKEIADYPLEDKKKDDYFIGLALALCPKLC